MTHAIEQNNSGTFRILVADDEKIARDNLEYVLKKEGYEVVNASNGSEAISAIGASDFDLVITDLRMDGADGIQVLESAKRKNSYTEVIMVTGYATVSNAVKAMQNGAYYYIPKPYRLDDVRVLVRQALEKKSLKLEVRDLRSKIGSENDFSLIKGNSPKIEALKATIAQIAPTDCSVIIQGETGTGKELVARTIHNSSTRSEARFMALNCGALNENLLANELFGHEKDAFTGARGVKKGLIESASGGTVFLDEIADMPMPMQIKLLRVIQEKNIIRVGGTKEIPIDVRFIAAANRNLKDEVEKGAFRQDLYFRLNVITLYLPALSERKDDIPLLCRHFLDNFAIAGGKPPIDISDEALDILVNYEFPGNIRELENIMERAVTLSAGKAISIKELPPDLQKIGFRIATRRHHEFMTLEENEKEYIVWVLQQVGNNRTRAAEILDIDRVSLWRKLRRYNID